MKKSIGKSNRALWRGKLLWAPIPLILTAITVLWIADLRQAYESQFLLMLFNFVFSTLASALVVILVGWSFLSHGEPGLLLLVCGVLFWGAAGTVAPALLSHGQNTMIGIHNILVWLSALCHLSGAGLSLKPGRIIRRVRIAFAASLTAVMSTVWVVVMLVLKGRMPVFFVPGQGGTSIRLFVLGSAIVMICFAVALLWLAKRRSLTPFVRWYGLALLLMAVGLFGVMIESVNGSALSWTGRTAQFLGGAYMLMAAYMSVRESGRPHILLTEQVRDRHENELLSSFRQQTFPGWVLRYGLALGATVVAIALRLVLTAWIGPGLPTYVMSYPAVIVVALVGGFGPGLAATTLTGFVVGCWSLPPVGQLATASPVDRLGLVIFICMGLSISVLAELYQRNRRKVAQFDKELALRESDRKLSDIYTYMSEGLALHEIVYDNSGKAIDYLITEANPAFEKITGLARSHVVGKKASLVYGTGEAPYLDTYSGVASTGKPASFEVHFDPMKKDFNISVFSPGEGKFATVFQDITERKQAEEYLRRIREDLDRAQAVGQIGSWRLDASRNVLTWSDENHRIFGVSKGTPLTYEAFLEIVHPDDRHYVDTQWMAGLRGEPYDIEHRLLVDGQVRWVREKAYLEFNDAGTLLGGFGITQDITERKEAELEQQANVELLRLINWTTATAELAKAALIFFRKESGCQAVGLRLKEGDDYPYYETAGFTQEFLEKETSLLGHSEEGGLIRDSTGRPCIECMCGNILCGRTDPSKPFFTANGSFWTNGTTALLAKTTEADRMARTRNVCNRTEYESVALIPLKANGEIIGLFHFADERKGMFSIKSIVKWERFAGYLATGLAKARSEEAMQESEDRFRTMANAMPQLAWIANADGYITWYNQRWYEYSGTTPEQMEGWGWQSVHDPIELPIVLDRWKSSIATGELFEMTFPLRGADGVFRPFLTRGFPLKDAKGQVVQWFGTNTDVSELKRVEAILKRDEETLRKLVEEQAYDLVVARIELEQAKRLSDIGTLSATVAHELRNPLAAIQIASHNIKRKANNPDDISKHIANIEKKVIESDQIINNLLFYSRLKPPHYESINIFDLLKECVEHLGEHGKKETLVTENLDVIKDISIVADPIQIKEVVNNILNNAYDAVLSGNGQIRIMAENEDEFIKVSIEDNGPGINKDILDKIFDPFFTTKAKGTGLGLSICRQIINMHGGEIGVKSESGQGTSIIVRLPKKQGGGHKTKCLRNGS